MRTAATPASIARSASEALKWMSAMIGSPASAHDRRQRVGVGQARHGDAHDLAAGVAQTGDLRERGVDVVRLGRRHRLHGDRRTATDRDAADHDLPLACHQTSGYVALPGNSAHARRYGPGRAPSMMRLTSDWSTSRKSTRKTAMPPIETRS